ncbi:hybrid sensor histidine kinase/response regulator [Rhodosalinus sediminis]|uniref:hybrid sensor histidine kinase/response regulator n=1 Tax=Rhodosalinus sediminis TaxID=1940533 RepID=UPI0023536FE4|nr:hybrid sensor histidine kinase/response regulator [Rhodosalinus sediminis]
MAAPLVLAGVVGFGGLLAAAIRWGVPRRSGRTRRSEQALAQLVDAAPDGIVVADSQGRVLRANPAAAALAPALRPVAAHGEGAPREAVALDDLLEDRLAPMIGAGAVRSRLRDGATGWRPVALTVTPIEGAGGERLLAVFLRAGDAEVGGEPAPPARHQPGGDDPPAREQAIAAVSHEMRTPLHALLAALDLLPEAATAADRDDLLAMARGSGARLRAMVEDALLFTRLSDAPGDAPVIAPSGIARDAIAAQASRAAAQGTDLRFEITGEATPRHYRGCASALARVVSGLVGQAVAAAPGGTVTVALHHGARAADGRTMFTLEVADDGPPPARVAHEQVFAPFGDAERHVPYDGEDGLGLVVARAIVAALGGTVTAERPPDGGARFRATLPLVEADVDPGAHRASPAAPSARPARALPAGGAALVADDAPVNVALMRRMVERLGFTVDTAADGATAAEMADRRSYALAVLDYRMPGLTGVEVAQRMRASERSGAAVILCVSAVADLIPPDALADAAVDAVLSKPLDSAALAAALEEITSGVPLAARDRLAAELDGVTNTLDRAELDALLGPDVAAEMIAAAVADAERACAALGDATLGREARVDIVHRAAGAAAMIGLGRLGALFRHAQRELEAGHDAALPQVQARVQADLSEIAAAGVGHAEEGGVRKVAGRNVR